MSDGMSMIFESMYLTHASPATVSRCGMIYVEPTAMGWQPLFESWICALNSIWITNQENAINELFFWLMDPCLEFIRKECRTTINIGQIHRAVSTMSIFQLLIEDAVQNNPKTFNQYLPVWFQAGMIISMIWGAASTLDCESRNKFDAFYLSLWKGEHPDYPLPTIVTSDPLSLPGEGSIYDQHYRSELETDAIIFSTSAGIALVINICIIFFRVTIIFHLHTKSCTLIPFCLLTYLLYLSILYFNRILFLTYFNSFSYYCIILPMRITQLFLSLTLFLYHRF